jgi:hypothetical protein
MLKRIAASLRVRARVGIAICDRIAAPVLIGILRPIILLPPAAITGWSPDEIEMVLLHELAHVRRWDNLVNLLQRCIESLQFFHPAVWLVSNWVRREREACCDAIVVRRTQRPHAYAELLVALAAQMPRSVLFHPAASSAMAAGPLRKRIRRILQLDDDPMLISGRSFALILFGLFIAAGLAVLYVPSIGQAEESTTEATESIEENTGKEKETVDSRLKADKKFQSLGEAVAEFNAKAQSDSVGAHQPPLTTDEVVAAIRGWVRERVPASGDVYATYQKIAKTQKLPPGAELSYTTGWQGPQGYDFQVWWIDLSIKTGPRSGYTFRIRDTKLRSHPSSEQDRLEVQTATTDIQSGKFPSLEDQKLADLVWKRLGLEMEPIGDKDLQRVKRDGYDGGLKVTAGTAGLADVGRVGGMIQMGDILVGLHVWPTTSLKDLVAILNRDDLAELNPLKFHVVRPAPGTANGPNGERMPLGDVVTGRVSVNVTDRIPVQPDGAATVPQLGTDKWTDIPRDLYYYRRVTPDQPGPGSDIPPFVLPSPEDEADLPKTPPVVPGTESDSKSNRRLNARRPAPRMTAPTGKQFLRYDDKNFDYWRSQWQNELSNEKRAEAVKALAAFGRAGYGKEATEAILDVAGNYDYYSFTTDDAETKLKDTIIKELVQESGNRELSKYWLPDLAARLKRDPEKWKDWAANLLHKVYTADPAGQTLLKSLAHEGPSDVRSAALGALIRASRTPDRKFVLDEETRELLHAALQSDDPMTVKFALQYLTYPVTAGVEPPVLLFQPELIPLLFHTDESVQRRARVCLRYLDEKDVPTVVKHLVGILQVESKQPDHRRAAIRALAAMGEKAQPAIPTLRNLVQPSADEGTLFAIFVALQEITREKYKRDFKSFNINDFMEGLGERDSIVIHEKMRGNSQRFDATVREETGSLVPQPNEQLGGGGFF